MIGLRVTPPIVLASVRKRLKTKGLGSVLRNRFVQSVRKLKKLHDLD